MDSGIAAPRICLTAAEQGLGSFMLGSYVERAIRAALHAPVGLCVSLVNEALPVPLNRSAAGNRCDAQASFGRFIV
jgi:hypothetical protein